MNSTSLSLLERLQKPGDQVAWSRFVELYSPMLFSWACRAGLNATDAADLVQDVFTLLVQKLPGWKYDESQSFRGWLRTLTLNKWRENHRRRRDPLNAAQSLDAGDSAVAVTDEPDFLSEEEYRQAVVERTLRLLKSDFQPTTWSAFVEYVVKDRPPAEVAAEVGISVRAVYIAKSRVLRRLRQELAGLIVE